MTALFPTLRHLRPLHLGAGLLLLAVFVGTGQYMDQRHNHLVGMPDVQRMLFRANHIYLLITALAHLVLGLYFTPASRRWRRGVQALGSACWVAAPVLFLLGFFNEPFLADLARPYTSPAIDLMLYGGLLHLAAVWLPDLPRRSDFSL